MFIRVNFVHGVQLVTHTIPREQKKDWVINMIRYWFIIILLISNLFAQNTDRKPSFHVKYISAEYVYLDAGRARGIQTGDTLFIRKSNIIFAQLEVAYTADYSSSCKIIFAKGTIKPGDIVLFKSKTKKEEKGRIMNKEKPDSTNIETPPAYQRFVKKTKKSNFRLVGNISAQYYYWKDLSKTGLDFSQPTIRLNLYGRNLWNRAYNFRIKVRTRYDDRARRLNAEVPKTEWRNRIYEFSFSYNDESAFFNYKLGRIISNQFSGVGYIDGLLLQQRLNQNFRTGVFAGTQPDWQYADLQTSIQKYGAYLTYLQGNYGANRYESTLALTGEYHSSTVSREYIYLQNNFFINRKWSLYQSMELDYNRSWRKERTNQTFSLSNLYISGRWEVQSWVSLGLRYDNRKNYQTYQTRTIADSLFDDALRQGLRGNISFILPANYRLFGNFGVRKIETEKNYTYSYASGISKVNFLMPGMRFFINGTGFSNFFTRGVNYSLTVGKYFRTNLNLDLGFGGYTYKLKADNTSRKNQWGRISATTNIYHRFYINSQYEYNWGDDVHGHQLFLEIGYRL
jgi:hypothetical protein